ncbi:DUF3127 domain-containing protein [Siphonobacter curvatus]|uniref:DUF3127 domain-containing protein n=1 Tax=Siphonobacter curvatus TaxID=2094562 RepID=A0A2S7IN22_9BACT|nr:DUF3127 domain-containing protein [Siphonobacter curvatus]PQA59143.1 hypothetical protein C5O19_05670 [Siphonobacter curvatus]
MISNNNSVVGQFLGAGKIITSDKGYKSRVFWINLSDDPSRPNPCEFELRNDNVSLVNELKKDETLEASFRLNGFKWEKDGRSGVMTRLQVYRITKIDRTRVQAEAGQEPETGFTLKTEENQTEDLPF